MERSEFVTAIACIDGRVQRPVADWLRLRFHVRWVDVVSVPGPDKVLAGEPGERAALLREEALVSVRAHRSGVIAVAGHHDCAANPVSKEEHLAQIERAAAAVAAWGLPVRVLGLWVNDSWWVDLVCELGG